MLGGVVGGSGEVSEHAPQRGHRMGGTGEIEDMGRRGPTS